MTGYGKPADVPGECNAHLYLADDYGDRSASILSDDDQHYAGVNINFLDRSTGSEERMVCYPVTRIELLGFDLERGCIVKQAVYVAIDSKWVRVADQEGKGT